MKLPPKLVERLEAHPKLTGLYEDWCKSFDPYDEIDELNRAYKVYLQLLILQAHSEGIIWITREQEVIFVEELEDGHLDNIIKFLERRLEEVMDAEAICYGYDGSGEAATYYAAQEANDAGARVAGVSRRLHLMREEQKRRATRR